MRHLIDILPRRLGRWVRDHDIDSIIEIVLDIGANPEIRFIDSYTVFDGYTVTEDDLTIVLSSNLLGRFNSDNRAGIVDTLHRVSAIRDQHNNIVGLTLRVGKPLYGCVKIIQDLIDSGESILILGRPGIGKTSKLRDAAKYLSIDLHKRVIIVDTANEIAGESVKPHPGVGRSRRMMIPPGRKQSEIMVEAVKNHTPETIVIDEISTGNEARSAVIIAERGVQLLATAHGNTLHNVIYSPELSLLVGQINVVTRTDKYANKHNTSKSQIERKTLPAFTKIVELIDFDTVAIHHDTVTSVDCLLQGGEVLPEVRKLVDGNVEVLQKYSATLPEPEPEPTKNLNIVDKAMYNNHTYIEPMNSREIFEERILRKTNKGRSFRPKRKR